MARLDHMASSVTTRWKKTTEFAQDGCSVVSDTIANSTVILDVSEDLVASRIGVVGRDTLMLDLFKPIGLTLNRASFTQWLRTFRAESCNVS